MHRLNLVHKDSDLPGAWPWLAASLALQRQEGQYAASEVRVGEFAFAVPQSALVFHHGMASFPSPSGKGLRRASTNQNAHLPLRLSPVQGTYNQVCLREHLLLSNASVVSVHRL